MVVICARSEHDPSMLLARFSDNPRMIWNQARDDADFGGCNCDTSRSGSSFLVFLALVANDDETGMSQMLHPIDQSRLFPGGVTDGCILALLRPRLGS